MPSGARESFFSRRIQFDKGEASTPLGLGETEWHSIGAMLRCPIAWFTKPPTPACSPARHYKAPMEYRRGERRDIGTLVEYGERNVARAAYNVGRVVSSRPFRLRRLGHMAFDIDKMSATLDFFARDLGLHVSDILDLRQHPDFAEAAGATRIFWLSKKTLRFALSPSPGLTNAQSDEVGYRFVGRLRDTANI